MQDQCTDLFFSDVCFCYLTFDVSYFFKGFGIIKPFPPFSLAILKTLQQQPKHKKKTTKKNTFRRKKQYLMGFNQ